MTFQHLPANVRDLPLSDPRLAADVIDLILSPQARRQGCVGLMLCDEELRGLQPVVLDDVPPSARLDTLRQLLDIVLPLMADQHGAVLIGRGRRSGLVPTDDDRAWHQTAIDGCATHGVRLLGYHLATPEGVVTLPEPLSAVS